MTTAKIAPATRRPRAQPSGPASRLWSKSLAARWSSCWAFYILSQRREQALTDTKPAPELPSAQAAASVESPSPAVTPPEPEPAPAPAATATVAPTRIAEPEPAPAVSVTPPTKPVVVKPVVSAPTLPKVPKPVVAAPAPVATRRQHPSRWHPCPLQPRRQRRQKRPPRRASPPTIRTELAQGLRSVAARRCPTAPNTGA